MSAHLEQCEFVAGLERLMEYTRFGNKYFDDKEIWQVIKQDESKAAEIMFDLLSLIIQLPILMEPYVPTAAKKLHSMINTNDFKPKWEKQSLAQFKLNKPVEILFNKLDAETVLTQKDK